jgi:hypothetical protein
MGEQASGQSWLVILKKVVLDVLLSVLVLIPAGVLGAVLSRSRPDCYTCGASVGLTTWFALVAALQPAIWLAGVQRSKRFLAWTWAAVTGSVLYFAMEATAGFFLFGGSASIGLVLGLASNYAFSLVALMVSHRLMRNFQGHHGEQIEQGNSETNDNAEPIRASVTGAGGSHRRAGGGDATGMP